jgi:ankyrin repeat protein
VSSLSSALPPRPSLEWLRKAAKDELRLLRADNPEATLAAAQRLVAARYGFSSWRSLKSHVDDLRVGPFLELVGTGQLEGAGAAIAADPGLVSAVGPHPFWGGRPQALHVAVEAGRRAMVDLLLESGADPSGRNGGYDHWSPLALALDRGHDELSRLLLARGAAVGLLEALLLGDDERVEGLLRGGLPAIRPNGGSWLAFARTPAALDWLLALGAERETKDRWGSTPMEALSRLGPQGRPLVRHLQQRGVPAGPQEYARLGDRAALAALAGTDPAAARSAPVLLGAVDFGHHELAQWLLASGADPNSRSTGHTALHSAAWEGDLRMARLLVEAGADPAARDDEHDNTPAGWARVAQRVTGNERCEEVAVFLDGLG